MKEKKNASELASKKWMPAMYVAYFGKLQHLAIHHGYALCVHGSITRDFDIIAVPFDPIVSSHDVLIREIKKMIGVPNSSNDPMFDIVGHEPHGRTCYTIECGGGGYFDISFTPTKEQATQWIKDEEKRKTDIVEMLRKMNNTNQELNPLANADGK